MDAKAIVRMVIDVQPHPTIDGLDVVTMSGDVNTRLMTNVANREDEQPRYKIGDLAVALTENLILPEWLLRHLDLWDEAKNKGILAGSKGNRTKARRIPNKDGGILSEVALCKCFWKKKSDTLGFLGFKPDLVLRVTRPENGQMVFEPSNEPCDLTSDSFSDFCPVGENVAVHLGITAYETDS